MFKKILIANRGEIACRVASTARRMGVQTVAVYSDADARSKHVQLCNEAVHVGGSAPKDSYLQWQRIIDAAKAKGAQAIHPGYGFLSENEEFAQACADAGLVFIGPPASAILAMGLKAESKRLMEQAGVPLVPGYHGADQDPELLKKEADRIGYPVLIKASAGGGGKGMRLVEKYVLRPRHIEIQVFGDTHGNYVYLFERDCSVQRRHQKVLEEAPAPGMTPELRKQMGEAAVAAARAVNYVGAGTVEFIVEQPGGYDKPEEMKFYFMEMNTRLQVEHPVTEAITGTDLVEWQLRVAAGEPLPKKQEELQIKGHAIEARINAENPENNFLPVTGTLKVYRTPEWSVTFERADARVDSGVREGDAISPFYDSMIAKLIVWGADREQALARLDGALAHMRIVGLTTNVQFLRQILATESFSQAKLDTALIPREADVLFGQDSLGMPMSVAAAIGHRIFNENKQLQGKDPFSRRDGWRAYGGFSRQFQLMYRDQPLQADLRYEHDGSYYIVISKPDGTLRPEILTEGPLIVEERDDGRMDVRYGEDRQVLQAWLDGEELNVFSQRGSSQITVVDSLFHSGEGGEGGRLTAPMPGKVVSFAVKAGDKVTKGQPLAVMEAMKMEHTISAPADGEVVELLFAPGDQVQDGDELLTLKSA